MDHSVFIWSLLSNKNYNKFKGWRFGWFPDSSNIIKSVNKHPKMSMETLSKLLSPYHLQSKSVIDREKHLKGILRTSLDICSMIL